MDESQLFQLIAEGENERIDFKRVLDLDSAAGKAEFVKDVISLANSASDTGYMLIGVENNGTIVGAGNLEEERIQQIANTYIDPPVRLHCSVIPASNLLTANVIEIKATQRPHKTVRAIDRLNQNEVFVRHGSVVVKASPSEIIELNKKSQIYVSVEQYVRAAVKHAELRNLQNAIRAYSQALDLAPTAELFLARGKIYAQVLQNTTTDNTLKYARLAYKDFSDAISLAQSTGEEEDARLNRLRINDYSSYDDFDQKTRAQDAEWLIANSQGRLKGEALYLDAKDADLVTLEERKKALTKLDLAFQLGYNEPDFYLLQAEINFTHEYNFGLALEYVDKAIAAGPRSSKKAAQCLTLRAHILSQMEDYRGARQSLKKASQMLGDEPLPQIYGTLSGNIERNILFLFGLDNEFGLRDVIDDNFLIVALQVLAIENKYFLPFGIIVNESPELRRLIGESLWQKRNQIDALSIGWYDADRNQIHV